MAKTTIHQIQKLRRLGKVSQLELAHPARMSQGRLSAAERGYLLLSQSELEHLKKILLQLAAERSRHFEAMISAEEPAA